MLTMQSSNGRINANGIRHVRQAVMTGEQVQRADVLAIITEVTELRRRLEEARSGAKIIALPPRRSS